MAAASYFITCLSSQEQQRMLLKSLFGIVGHRSQNDNAWTYRDTDDGEEPRADVLIVDYDDGIPAPGRYTRVPVIVALSRDPDRVKDIPLRLLKPLRSRDLLNLLAVLDDQMDRQHMNVNPALASALPQLPARSDAPIGDDPLDGLLALARTQTTGVFSLHFGSQTAWLDAGAKRLLLPADFRYDLIPERGGLVSRPGASPTVPVTPRSLADFFYECTLQEKQARLLDGINGEARFQIRQWPHFLNARNTKAVVRISAYFSKHKTTLQAAARDLSVDMLTLMGFINAVYAQNQLIVEADFPMAVAASAASAASAAAAQIVKPQPETAVNAAAPAKLGGLFGRIRARLGI